MCQLGKPIAKLLTACRKTKKEAPALHNELRRALVFANHARELDKTGPAFMMARQAALFMALVHIRRAKEI